MTNSSSNSLSPNTGDLSRDYFPQLPAAENLVPQPQPQAQPSPESYPELVTKILLGIPGVNLLATSKGGDHIFPIIQALRDTSHPVAPAIVTFRPFVIQQAMEVLGYSCPVIEIRECQSLSSPPSIASMFKVVRKRCPGVNFIILDSIYHFLAPSSIYNLLKVGNFLSEANSLCAEYKIPLLGTATATQSKYSPRERLSGSGAWASGVDTIFLLNKLGSKKYELLVLPRYTPNKTFMLAKGANGEFHLSTETERPKRKNCRRRPVRRARVRKCRHNRFVESTAVLESNPPVHGESL